MGGKRTSRGPLEPRHYLASRQQPESAPNDCARLDRGRRVAAPGRRQLKEADLVVVGSGCVSFVDEGDGDFTEVVGAAPFASRRTRFGLIQPLTFKFTRAHPP